MTNMKTAVACLLLGLALVTGLRAQGIPITTVAVNPQSCTAQEGAATVALATCGFKFTKAQSASTQVVNFKVLATSSATEGVDYTLHAVAPAYPSTGGVCVANPGTTLVTNSVCIPGGASSAFVKVVPKPDALWEPSEYVYVSVSNGFLPPSSASVKLQDNDTYVKITTDQATSTATKSGLAPAYFKVERYNVIGLPSEDLVVHYTITPALPNSDFTISPDTPEEPVGKFTIRSSTLVRFIRITPKASAVVPKTVTLTLTSKAWYTRGSPYSASVQIVQ